MAKTYAVRRDDKRIRTAITLDPQIAEFLQEEAREQRRSVSGMLDVILLARYGDKHEPIKSNS